MPTGSPQIRPECNSTLMTEMSSLSNCAANETQIWNGTAREDYVITIVTYAFTPVIIVGLIGNGAIFPFLCCRLKRTKYTVYVLNLAISDFTILFSYLINIVFSLIIWRKLDFEGYLYIVSDFLSFFGYNTSFFLLTTISVERCLGAFCPFWYHNNRPKHLSGILCALLWILSCVVTGVEFFTCWSEYVSSEEPCYRKYIAENLFLIIIFLIFTPIMVLCSLSLFIKIWGIPWPKSPARLCLTIVITVALFLILALPFRISSLIGYWHPEMKLNWTLMDVSCLLAVINSSVNPFVYFFVGRQTQKRLRSREALSAVLHRSWMDEIDVVATTQEHIGSDEQEA
ncbi:proto-oncogene Mas-like [Rhineura floridana]|uniref:proto-oncogene Mas-like n=1 Tax=Rhineura floridana TaxID=261503 RepID=UPI002AC82BE7|nr:proto-oncogene Mas-like [Rhineura floridana]